MREWYRRPGRAQAQRESKKASRERRIEEVRAYDRARGHRVYDPQAEVARQRLNKALAGGKIRRQPCEVCGHEPAEAHHPDYSQPLTVRWLCRPHHMALHRKVA
jgi:hypothetical protein